MNRTAIFRLSVLLTLLPMGCASYGWADASGDKTGHELRVETIAAPAHLGLDQSALRTLLIDELELSGVTVTGSGQTSSLRCAVVDYETTGFQSDLFAEFDLACDIHRPGDSSPATTLAVTGFSAETTGTTQVTAADTNYAEHRAVIDAFSRMAPQVATALQNSQHDATSDD